MAYGRNRRTNEIVVGVNLADYLCQTQSHPAPLDFQIPLMSGIRSGKEREDHHDAKQKARLPVWRVLGVNRKR